MKIKVKKVCENAFLDVLEHFLYLNVIDFDLNVDTYCSVMIHVDLNVISELYYMHYIL